MTFEEESEKYRRQAMEAIDNLFENFQTQNANCIEYERKIEDLTSDNEDLRDQIAELELRIKNLEGELASKE